MSGAVDALSDRVLHGILSASPDLALVLGVDSVAGTSLPVADLPDFSEGGVNRRAVMVRDWAHELDAIPTDQDGPKERLTREVLAYVLKVGFFNRFHGLRGQPYADQIEPLTHLGGVHATAVQMLVRDHPFATDDSGERWIERLSHLPTALSDATATLEARRRRGLVAPRPLLERALADIGASVTVDPRDHLFRRALERGLTRASVAPRERLLAVADKLLSGDVRAAYGRLLEEIEHHCAASNASISAQRRHGGPAFYAWRFAGHTTTDLSPERAHSLGLEEIARLDAELRIEFDQLGVAGPRADAFRALTSRDAYPPGESGRMQALADAREQVESARSAVRPLFNLWPAADVGVEPYATADEASQHTLYIPPPSEGAAATYWINLAQASAATRSELAVTSWHETWPGHHLQLSLARTLPLPAFRRNLLLAAYLEGWAKYAEALPETVGLATSPFARVARLRMELYSTATLVMDTGVHTKGWSALEAAAYFEGETGATPALSSMVALRSAADPGHLCAYKIGLLKVRELRDRFAAARRETYRAQDFHDAVLGQGALPLSVLDRVVTERARAAA